MSRTATTRAAASKAARVAPPRRQPAPDLKPLADEGIVVAIVAVTGHDDHVGDVIAPGAFTKTLKTRKPKVCFNHSWADPLGRVLHIVEYMPGDARLPKMLPDGRPWPRGAGAVIATMQYHMSTERGREMFAHTKEWAAAGEAAFSIGYKATKASKRADGVRVIYELQLFEVSLVLHGAHDMALALEVKTGKPTPFITNDPDGTNWVEQAGGLPPYIREIANALVREHAFSQEHAIATAVNRVKRWSAGMDNVKADTIAKASAALAQWETMKASTGVEGKALDMETRTGPAGMTTVVESDTQPDFSGSSMLALVPDAATAGEIAVAGGTAAEELHVTVAFLGATADLDTEALLSALTPALAGLGPLAGSVGGLGMFPEGENGTPVWVPVDVPGLDRLRTATIDALDAAGMPQQSEHGYTPHMTLGYDLESVDPVEPVPVSFSEAVLFIGTERLPIPLTAPAGPPMEGKAALMVKAARAERIMSNLEHKSAASVVLEAKSYRPAQEIKSMRDALAGSYEDLARKLRDAAHSLFAPSLAVTEPSGGMDRPGPSSPDVWVEATFPDYIVVTLNDYSAPPDKRDTTYVIPYTLTADGAVALGVPEEAKIEVTVTDAAPDVDGDLPVVTDPLEAGFARFTLPLEAMLADANALAMRAPEGKTLAEAIRGPLDAFLDTLAGKGLPYSPDPLDDDDEDWGVLAAELDADVARDDDVDADMDDEVTDDAALVEDLGEEVAPGIEYDDDAAPLPPAGPGEDDVVVMDPSEIDADMAELEDNPDDDEALA